MLSRNVLWCSMWCVLVALSGCADALGIGDFGFDNVTGSGGQSASTGDSGAPGTGESGASGSISDGTACDSPADCNDPGECLERTCEEHVCGAVPMAPGTTCVTGQISGDCLRRQCDGDGGVESVPDDNDIEVDGSGCSENSCADGMKVAVKHAGNGVPCGVNGALQCDGAGKCVGCATPAECTAPPNTCLLAACTAGTCEVANRPEGSTCTDGDACTQSDTCQAGSCVGSDPVTCLSLNQCHIAGTCNPATGICSNPYMPATCGDSESCCASSVVTGGAYNRSNNASYPATVTDFRLDRFEVTVGRFRQFLAGYPENKPKAGAGAHPLVTDSGWSPAWPLPPDQAALEAAVKCADSPTWTETAGANENRPMNCLNWYVAFAFCAWDGGRLPTEAEWNYAAAGGDEHRGYPWGSAVPTPAYAAYACNGDGLGASCASTDIVEVGSKPAGDGKWGQADLAGNVVEWNFDGYGDYFVPCADCANVDGSSGRVARGGSWFFNISLLHPSYRTGIPPSYSGSSYGVRCARTP